MDPLLNRAQVAERLTVCQRTVFRLQRDDDDFPKPLPMGVRKTVWTASSIDRYIEALSKRAQRGGDRRGRRRR
jgi:predicted DNA-binding transcriptional regulator AlpA